MRTDTKAYRILQMHRSGAAPSSIALMVGVSRDYVRVVLNQRGEAGRSIYDDRYRYSDKGRDTARRLTRRHAVKSSAYGKKWSEIYRATGDRNAARAAGRKAYAEARNG